MSNLRFSGADYQPARDDARLEKQYDRVFFIMQDGRFRTLKRISELTGDPESSISAQLRHMRKQRFGSHDVNRNYLGDGIYEYQLVVNVKKAA